MTPSVQPVLALHILARVQLISEVERLAPERGLKEAVALMRGATQVERVVSLFIDLRKVEHPSEIPEGIRVMLA